MKPGQRAGGAPQQRRDRRAVTRSAASVVQQHHSLHAARSKECAATAAHLVTSEAAQRPSLVSIARSAQRTEHASAAQRRAARNLCEYACDIMSHLIDLHIVIG